MDIPMLESEEFEQFIALWRAGMRGPGATIAERACAALDYYEKVTGFHETNINAAAHHAVHLVGPPCERCGKVLRTPSAAFCFLCGKRRSAGPWLRLRHVPLPASTEPDVD